MSMGRNQSRRVVRSAPSSLCYAEQAECGGMDHWTRRGWAVSAASIDPYELALEGFQILELSVDSGGKGGEIRIGGADEDAGVIRVVAVKADEVLAVVGEDGTFVCCGKAQNLVIGGWRRLPCLHRTK